MNRVWVFLATGAGLGFSPVASGTVGSVWGVLLVWLMQPLSAAAYAALCLGLTLIAVPICGGAEKVFGRKDDGRIVADEYLTFPICMIGLPFTPWLVAVSFLSNRFFDILKPPPARQLQALHGGIGIVIDDVLATFYSLAFNHLVYWAAQRWLVA